MPLVFAHNEASPSDISYADVMGESYEYPARYKGAFNRANGSFIQGRPTYARTTGHTCIPWRGDGRAYYAGRRQVSLHHPRLHAVH